MVTPIDSMTLSDGEGRENAHSPALPAFPGDRKRSILVNHTSGAVTPLDPELIQVGDAIAQRAQQRGLVQGSVRPAPFVEVLVLAQHDHQMP